MDPNLSTTWQFGSILITVPPGRHRGAKLRLCCNFNKTRQSAEEGGSVCVWGEGEGGGDTNNINLHAGRSTCGSALIPRRFFFPLMYVSGSLQFKWGTMSCCCED